MMDVRINWEDSIETTQLFLPEWPAYMFPRYALYSDCWGGFALELFYGALCFPDFMTCREAVGYVTSAEEITVQVRGHAPSNAPYRGTVDDWRFGWRDFRPPLPKKSYPRPRMENEVFHSSYRGNALSGAGTLGGRYTRREEDNTFWTYPDAPGLTEQETHRSSLLYDDNVVTGFGYDWASIHAKFFAEYHGWLSAKHFEFPIRKINTYPGGPSSIDLDSFTIDVSDTVIWFTASGHFRQWGFAVPPNLSNPHTSIPFTEQMVLEYKKPVPTRTGHVPDGYRPLIRESLITYEFEYGDRQLESGATSFHPWTDDRTGQYVLLHDYMSPVVSSAVVKPSSLRRRVYDGFNTTYTYGDPGWGVLTLESHVSRDILNLLPGFFYSASDATQKHITRIKANHLENLAQLGEVASLLPDVANFIQFITSARRGELLKAGTKLLDIWSETQLSWDYGIKPSLNDISELSNEFDSVVTRLREEDLWGHRTLYGSFDYILPQGSYGFDSITRLKFRSKVDVTFGYSSILASLLKGQAIGLLPSFSNLWDLVPFSFVVDWFFNIGDRIKDLENYAFALMLQTHFTTNSLLIEKDFSSRELELRELVGRGGLSAPGMRIYIRLPSRRFPPLKDSIYDYRAASGPSSLLTAGALVYQLIKS